MSGIPTENDRRRYVAAAVRASVERLEAEKLLLLALPFTRERSRRVDVIDANISAMWDRLIVDGRAA